MANNKILIIGKKPPPIGGVTIHNQRLVDSLSETELNFEFYNLVNFKFVELLQKISQASVVHLQLSNPILRFVLALFSCVLRKKSINTIHGNLGRFSKTKNIFDYLSVYLVTSPILLNEGSFIIAKKYNKKSKLLSAFIPPKKIELLDNELIETIIKAKAHSKLLFCTNASSFSLDSSGSEIYGILKLIDIFKIMEGKYLVVSDPSSEYKNYFKKNHIKLPSNVLLISKHHSFYEILKLSDVFVRATTTDGDAISINEALFLNVTVIASDCVKRPVGVILYDSNNSLELETIILKQDNSVSNPCCCEVVDASNCIIAIYKELLLP